VSTRLYRPVGAAELALIEVADWRAFPPRLPEQPIFYPVLNFEYAEQIARDWNSKHEDAGVGYVVEFDLSEDPTGRWPVQVAGGRTHQELWVPADELDAFNELIDGKIRLSATYRDGRMVGKAE
jgi:hypothetical protein